MADETPTFPDHIVIYPRIAEISRKIDRCRRLTAMTGEPHCLAIVGATGAGKTSLVLHYASKYPRTDDQYGTNVPVFYVAAPSPITVKGASAEMLRVLGDPAWNRGRQWEMNDRLRHLLKACGTELVIIDEVQHLIDAKTKRVVEKVSEWLKSLIKSVGIPFVIVGIAGQVEPILKTNAQLRRLFSVTAELAPFTWNYNDTEADENVEFAEFVMRIARSTSLTIPDGDPTELFYRIHYATDGVVANVTSLLFYAAVEAEVQDAKTLDLSLLTIAFNEQLAARDPSKENPFMCPISERFVPQTPSESINADDLKYRTVADTLKT
jgi:GTPase SAR1 family protein